MDNYFDEEYALYDDNAEFALDNREPFDGWADFGSEGEGYHSELDDLEWERELRRRGRGVKRPRVLRIQSRRPAAPFRLFRPPPPWPGRRPRPPRSPFPRNRRIKICRRPLATIRSVPQGSEHMRWVQSSLNRIMGLRLPVDGIGRPKTRSAIRSFQRKMALPVDGIVGPETERALISARSRHFGTDR